MNPHLCRVALRPRDPAESLDLAFALLRVGGRPALRLAAASLGPIAAVGALGCWWTDGHWALLALPLASAPVLQALFLQHFGQRMFDDAARPWAAAVATARRLPALIVAWIVMLAVWGATSLTCFAGWIPGAALVVYLPFTTALERVPLGRAWQRSQRLATSNLMMAMAAAAAGPVLLVWGAVIGEMTWQGIVDTVLQAGLPMGSALGGRVTPGLIAGMLVVQPLIAAYRLLLYVDVRTRAEGWDLQVALRAAGKGR